MARHQPIGCYDCARASHNCHCQQVPSPTPLAATSAQVQTADSVAFVPPPTTTTPKLVVRPELIQTRANTAKAQQKRSRSLPDVANDSVTSESAEAESALDRPRPSGSLVSPNSRNAVSTSNHAVEDLLVDKTGDATTIMPIEDVPEPTTAPDAEIPSAKPSNTLIMEIDDGELSNPQSKDQGQNRPAQAIPKLKVIVDSEFSAALQMSGRDDPQATVIHMQKIMFAVPPLRPSNIPPIVRFVRIEDAAVAKNHRQPYSLTTAPALPGTQVQPIEPVLEGLRIGRPIIPEPNVDTIQR